MSAERLRSSGKKTANLSPKTRNKQVGKRVKNKASKRAEESAAVSRSGVCSALKDLIFSFTLNPPDFYYLKYRLIYRRHP